MKRILGLIIFYVVTHSAFALSPTEIAISNEVAKETPAQLQLLEKLVNINSGSTNPQGVRQASYIVKRELEKLGFYVYLVEEPKEMHRGPTLIAERKGTKGKRILLIGHLDTVYSSDSKSPAFQLLKNTAKGPGVIDDKGGVVVILSALKALYATNELKNKTITVVLTGDEESSGKPTSISRKPLKDSARGMDIALDFEPGVSLDKATIGRRGISDWFITSNGNESHSATIFQKHVGDGAVFELARILNTMRTRLLKTNITFNPGLIAGGTKVTSDIKTSQLNAYGKTNVVSKIAMASGDFRYLTLKEKSAFQKKLTLIVSHHLVGTKSSLRFEDGIPAMQPTKKNLALLKKYSAVSMDLKLGKVTAYNPAKRGAGDISYIADIVPANLSGLGPLGLGSHSVIETIELKSLPIQTQRAAILIYRLK